MFIKRRKAKASQRGIYLQDNALLDTNFKIGDHFRYIIDAKNRKVTIVPADSGNIVSKRQLEGISKPVIDIRTEEVKALCKNADYLQVTINKDFVVVEVFEDVKDSASTSSGETYCTLSSNSKVTSITDLINVKKRGEFVLSKSNYKKVAGLNNGLFEQISIDSILNSYVKSDPLLSATIGAYEAVSFFSGCGMLDKAFLDMGFDITFAIDFDSDACRSYAHNFGNHIVHGDITKIDKSTIPKAPVSISGIPCHKYSNSNRVATDRYQTTQDNTLIDNWIECQRINDKLQVFVVENVPQLLTACDGAFIKALRERLSDFHLEYGVLNSADMGSPQVRKRAVVIGSKIGPIKLPKAITDVCKTVREAFKGLTNNTPNQLDVTKASNETLEKMRYIKPGGNVLDIPSNIRPKGTHSDIYKRLEWDKPSVTIVNPRKAMLLHPSLNRILSVRECLRIQGFNDNFELIGTLSAKQQQAANGVPLQLGQAIARVVKQALDNLKYNKLCLVK